MRKKVNFIFLILFLAMLLVPFCLTNRESEAVSEIDNRTLATAPLLGSETFSTEYETWLKDRIGLRNQMVSAYAVLNSSLAGELTHPLYTYGQDGYIFFNMGNKYIYGDFHKSFAEMVLKLQEYVESRGSKFYFMFEPEKSSVLRRYLPAGVNYDDSWVDEMLDYMEELGVHYVSNKELLTEKSYSEDVFNRQYDAGHWNDLGCFYGTNNLLRLIHEDLPEVKELNKDEFDISSKIAEYLPVSKFKVNEEVPLFTLKTDYENIASEYSSDIELDYRFGYFHYLINKADNADELPKTLIFQGSYYNSRNQYFVSRTSEYIGVHNYQNVMNIDYYYNIFQPDVVIFEATQYTFSNTYFDLENMKQLNLNPSLFDFSSDNQSIRQTEGSQDRFGIEEIESLKREAEEVAVDEYAQLLTGNKVDRVLIDHIFSDLKYAYLISPKGVFDLTISDNGFCFASIPGGILKENDSITFYMINNDDRAFYCDLGIRYATQYGVELSPSANAEILGDKITLTTDLGATLFSRGNIFSSVVLQLQNADTGEYINNICYATEKGVVKGIYSHIYDDGWYHIILKGNTNIKDESVDCLVYLQKDHGYYYSFSVDNLREKKIELSNFIFFGTS